MKSTKVYHMKFKDLYPLYIQKALKKQRTKEEVDELILWLTGYSKTEFEHILTTSIDVETFLNQSPMIHPNAHLITGKICGVLIETIEDPIMKKIRYLDKLIDELAKGKSVEKIKRT